MLRDHLARRRDIEIVFSDETDELLDTGGGVVKAMPHFGDAPFFIINSNSIWVEGTTAALPAMIAAVGRRPHGRAVAAGRHDTPPWAMKAAAISCSPADGHVVRARGTQRRRLTPIPACRSCIRACSPMRRKAPSPPTSCGTAPSPPAGCSARVLDGVWIHVGTPQARDEAEAYLAALAPA